jgi:uncharacterized protein (TIGR02301 family)
VTIGSLNTLRGAGAAVCLLTAATGAGAQTAAAPDPPYEAKLVRLAEVLGSIHFLRHLCGDQSLVWRQSMGDLIENEVPTPERKARLTASFNHGYRSFDGVYLRCTDAAATALSQYMREGEALTLDISTRYGN